MLYVGINCYKSLYLCLPTSLISVRRTIGCHLFITTNQCEHPHKTDSTRAQGGPPFSSPWGSTIQGSSSLSTRSVQLRVESDRIGSGSAWAWAFSSHLGWVALGSIFFFLGPGLCNKVLNHWHDINPKLWHTLSMQKTKNVAPISAKKDNV